MTLDKQLATQIQRLNSKSIEELRLFVMFLLQKQQQSVASPEDNSISWPWEKFPHELSSYIVQEENLDALAEVFNDAPSAEALCNMLKN